MVIRVVSEVEDNVSNVQTVSVIIMCERREANGRIV